MEYGVRSRNQIMSKPNRWWSRTSKAAESRIDHAYVHPRIWLPEYGVRSAGEDNSPAGGVTGGPSTNHLALRRCTRPPGAVPRPTVRRLWRRCPEYGVASTARFRHGPSACVAPVRWTCSSGHNGGTTDRRTSQCAGSRPARQIRGHSALYWWVFCGSGRGPE